MPSLRRKGRKTADIARLSTTLDDFVRAQKLSSNAEQALRSKSEELIQRVLSGGPLAGPNPNLALAQRIWSLQAADSEPPQARQVQSESQIKAVTTATSGWARWLAAKSKRCRVSDACDPCSRPHQIESSTTCPANCHQNPEHLGTQAPSYIPEALEHDAEQGSADAQFELGASCAAGMLGVRDEERAVHWYTLAAEQGLAKAQFSLGLCYKQGRGVAQDPGMALKWFTRAGNQAHAEAQFQVALCHLHGEGMKKVDAAKAARWLKKAASRGHSRAQFELGLCHSKGLGVPREDFFAFVQFRAAALQDLEVAEYQLAGCYHRGIGVEKDMALAIDWYTRAAEQGHSGAQYDMAVCYLTGDGVVADVELGMMWMQRAAERGYAQAAAFLED
ncbi:esiB [Symbiodinium sp. CCMP2456]|nr:esiB [Symbiodinium sp. CCMP2456]